MRYEEEPHQERRYEENPSGTPLDTLKCKFPPFVGDRDVVIFRVGDKGRPSNVREGIIRHINTWLDLRREMRSRFVTGSYAWDLYNKLYRMHQGSKS
ncbi:hypothetical protein CR513_03689, partial [Mucuna pruriens]